MREWKDVQGYEGLYQVSDDGVVRSMPRKSASGRTLSGVILRQHTVDRYNRVTLYKGGKRHTYMVHRLVARAFCPNPENKPQVNHIDGNRFNNRAENLEWCTQAENNKHAWNTGLQPHDAMVKATRKSVLQIADNGEVVKVWDSMSDAARSLGLQVSNISHCCSGRISKTGGFKWILEH